MEGLVSERGNKADRSKYNMFRLAKKEQQHSTFWGWVIQTADSQGKDLEGPRAVAHRLFHALSLAKPRSVWVDTEVAVGGLRDRVDILVRAREEGEPCLVIEHKVSAIPDADQARRYQKALGKAVKVAILSTAFDDDVRSGLPCAYLGAERLLDFFKGVANLHPVTSDYRNWLEATIKGRVDLAKDAHSSDPRRLAAALATAEGQWALMTSLTKGMQGRQYRGVNIGGKPWTQFRFCEESDSHDAIFFRIDVSAVGPYFAIRQYQAEPRPSASAKQQRLMTLRHLWNAAVKRHGSGLKLRPPGEKGVKECKIGGFLLGPNSPSQLQQTLPAISRRFLSDLASAGCPVEAQP